VLKDLWRGATLRRELVSDRRWCGAEQHRELVSEGAEAPGWLDDVVVPSQP
jgi:hypothetical protein